MRSGRRRSFREFSEAMPSTSSCRRFRRRAVSCSVRSKSPRRFRAKKNFRLRNTLTHLVRFSIPRFENRTYLLSGAGGEMQFFLLRKIRRRTGNTPRSPFVQTCIRPQGEKLAHGKPGSPYSTLLRPRSKGSRFRRKRFPPARCCRGRNSCPRKDAPGRSGAECNRPSQFATVLQNGVPRSVIVRRSVPFPERNRGCQLKIRNC